MESKKKICKRCNKEKRIWARNLCQSCDRVSNPGKYMIEKKATKKKESKNKELLPSYAKLKQLNDDAFSQKVRLTYADENGYVICYTCDKSVFWFGGGDKGIQNGHHWSRGKLGTRYSMDNCRPQCFTCNIRKKGNYPEFSQRLRRELGDEKFDLLEIQAKEDVKYSRLYLKAMLEDTLKEVEELKKKLK